VHARGLRLAGAHAGLLDLPGGVDGLDRRGAAQRFLDRVVAGDVRVDDLVTERVHPLDAAGLYDRLARDRTMVVPVIEWWRLPPDLRARSGGLALPNPFRRGLAGAAADPRPVAVPPVTDHPPAPPRPEPAPRVAAGAEAREAEAAAAAALRAGGPVEVAGAGTLAELVRSALAVRGALAEAGGRPGVVVLVDPVGESLAGALAGVGPGGTVVVAGR